MSVVESQVDAPFTLTDPTEAPRFGDGMLSRWCRARLADPRDEVFIRLTIRSIAIMLAAMTGLGLLIHRSPQHWWIGALAYLAVWGWSAPPVILMLHCTMHRRFFASAGAMSSMHPYAMSALFGIPTGYKEHHINMHHAEDNAPGDLSSTARFQRDSFFDFLRYFGRFFFFIHIELPLYFVRKNRRHLAVRTVGIEIAQNALVLGVVAINWRFGVPAFLLPYVICRFMMMAGNWGQHAFLNTDRKNDGMSNAITCINSGYNRRAFNDGYHIGHHLMAARHWTELPRDFQNNWQRYGREGAIVFEGLDFFMVSFLLWTKQYSILARRYVRLNGEMTNDEVIALLHKRVAPIRDLSESPAPA